MYYANANRFNEEILGLVDGADAATPVRCVVLDAAAMVDVDYSGGLTLKQVVNELHDRGATLSVTQAEDSVRAELDRFGITEMIGADAYFDTVGDAVRAHEAKGPAPAGPATEPAPGGPARRAWAPRRSASGARTSPCGRRRRSGRTSAGSRRR